ncbi:MAG: UDP-2,4-diacetamido-2,4,6-trideoxy-beta-L-altropyranose hydrolase [Flavobacteriaceae bacterium]|nr:UDP-2,4-diacetamido-2,4,6-trideoxy-beta-L-altropyranose hydrolase [Flavobacteriaceae bacterium]
MNIGVRVEASDKIGTGHLKRCISLSLEIKENLDADVIFFFSGDDRYLDLLKNHDLAFHKIKSNTFNYLDDVKLLKSIVKKNNIELSFIIVDHYKIDINWEKQLSDYKIIVLDDLANRKHHADILIDQNLYNNYQKRYLDLVNKGCILLLGPKYAILNNKYKKLRKNLIKKNSYKNVLISFGGTDEFELTEQLLAKFSSCPDLNEYIFHAVVTKSFKNKPLIRSYSRYENIEIYEDLDCLSSLMYECDFSIGAGGTTTWERFAMKLPAIVITIAENQVESANYLKKNGFIDYIGKAKDLRKDWIENIISMIKDKKNLESQSKKISDIVDAEGTKRIINSMINLML